MNDLRFALRQLSRSPGFTTTVILTIALGIGANTVIFGVVNTAFLRALPYPEPDRLVHLSERGPTAERMPVSYPNFLDWQAQQDVFDGLAVYHSAEGRLGTPQGTELVAVLHVSAEFFDVLGVTPLKARGMRPEDDLPGAERVAWVTSGAWPRLFGGDPDLVGRSLRLDGRSVGVAGILPPGFRFHRRADLITPIAPYASEFFLDMRENHNNEMAVARLAPGVDLGSARARMDAVALRLATEYPGANERIEVVVMPLREELAGGALLMLLTATLACLVPARRAARAEPMEALRTE